MKLTESFVERLSDLLNAATELVKQVGRLFATLIVLVAVAAITYWILYDLLQTS